MFEITVKNDKETVILFDDEMLSISSAVFGGGICKVNAVINYSLGNEFVEFSEMKNFCKTLAKRLLCNPDKTVVLLTKVPQQYGEWSSNGCCFATVGLGNATTLFPSYCTNPNSEYIPGTINCINIVEKPLTKEALIEAYGVAKITQGFCTAEWSKLKNKDGPVFVGTPSDCSVVICGTKGKPLHFAGLGTEAGHMIAEQTRDAFFLALSHKYPLCRKLRTLKTG